MSDDSYNKRRLGDCFVHLSVCFMWVLLYTWLFVYFSLVIFYFPQSEEDRLQDQREKEELSENLIPHRHERYASCNLIAGMLCLISPEIVFVVLQYFGCSRNVTWLEFSISFLGKIVWTKPAASFLTKWLFNLVKWKRQRVCWVFSEYGRLLDVLYTMWPYFYPNCSSRSPACREKRKVQPVIA